MCTKWWGWVVRHQQGAPGGKQAGQHGVYLRCGTCIHHGMGYLHPHLLDVQLACFFDLGEHSARGHIFVVCLLFEKWILFSSLLDRSCKKWCIGTCAFRWSRDEGPLDYLYKDVEKSSKGMSQVVQLMGKSSC